MVHNTGSEKVGWSQSDLWSIDIVAWRIPAEEVLRFESQVKLEVVEGWTLEVFYGISLVS